MVYIGMTAFAAELVKESIDLDSYDGEPRTILEAVIADIDLQTK